MKNAARGRIAVALSGGVDSTAAALLLLRDGWEVVGATLLLAPGGAPPPELECFCRENGIPLAAIDAAAQFDRAVIRPAAAEYASGRTPNPCCECNELLKFALLEEFARRAGADALATGHYCRTDGGGIVRGADRGKDQSYFLYRLHREMLPFLRFPLGGMTKPQVRAFAREAKLSCAEKPDSQDVCFAVPGECCGDTLLRRAGLAPRPGRVFFAGRTVGRHSGIHRITLGQRGGLGVALGVPAYVRSIDPASGDVELCTDRELLACRSFRLSRVNWQRECPAPEAELEVQIRYRSRPARCRVFPGADGTCRIETADALYAVTPGQAGVIYEGDRLVGGGVIELENPTSNQGA